MFPFFFEDVALQSRGALRAVLGFSCEFLGSLSEVGDRGCGFVDRCGGIWGCGSEVGGRGRDGFCGMGFWLVR